MPPGKPVDAATLAQIKVLRELGTPAREISRRTGVGRTQLSRLIVDRVRKAEDFAGSAAVRERAPHRRQPDVLWSIEKIRAARDAQMRGDFAQPVRLAEAMRTDDALYTAYHNRIAPQSAVATKLVPTGGDGEAVCRKAQASCFVSRGTLVGIAGTLANHAIAVGYIIREPSDDGTRVDLRLTEWPLEFVRWNPTTEQLETQTKHGGAHVPIVHGDGYWVVFKKTDVLPWTQEAALLPASMIWGAHAYALADWAGASKSHGLAKIVGELPEGISLQEKLSDGSIKLNAEADAFLQMIQDVVSGEAQAAVRPAGSKLDVLANTSTMYQIFSELITDRKKAAAFVYLGTDASLGAAGGAPGVDVSALFGISSTKLQGDFDALEQGLNTGFYPVWTAINCGDSRYSPRIKFQIPDPDAKAKSEESAAKRTRLTNAIKEMKDTGMIVDQLTVDRLAAEIGVSPAPLLASGDTKAVPIPLAPTDIAKIVRVGPALRSIGLEPFGDARDGMTIPELDEFVKAKASGGVAAAPAEKQALSKLTTLSHEALVMLAGRTFDESKISRDGDGKFGSGPGNPNTAGPSGRDGGGSEGNGPKVAADGSGESADGDGKKTEVKDEPKTRAGKAEKRLGEAREVHEKARAEEAKAVAELNTHKAEMHAKVDEQLRSRTEAAERAEKYAGEVKTEIKAVRSEASKLEKEREKTEHLRDANDTHPLDEKINELESREDDLIEIHSELKSEARANKKPLNAKRVAALRQAIDSGDPGAIEEAEDRLVDNASTEYSNDYELEKSLPPRSAFEQKAREHYKADGFTDEPSSEYVERRSNRLRERYKEAERDKRAAEAGEDQGLGVTGGLVDGQWVEPPFNKAAARVEKTRAKRVRAERAVKAHEREVKRVGGKIDADGDGRTGDAEERDDKKEPKA